MVSRSAWGCAMALPVTAQKLLGRLRSVWRWAWRGYAGLVADRKAYCKRTLGLCLEQRVGLSTVGPRTCAVRQE